MITAEKQKGYIYYRCTKKKTPCDEKYIREEAIAEQLKNSIQKVSLPEKWATKIINALDTEKEKNLIVTQHSLQNLKGELKAVEEKLSRLLDAHLETLIHKQEYISKKEVLLNQKTSLLEKISDFEENSKDRLEQAREFILSSCQAKKVARQGDLGEIKTFLKNIGSNFTVRGQKFNFEAVGIWKALYENLPNSSWRERRESNPQPHPCTDPIFSYWRGLYHYHSNFNRETELGILVSSLYGALRVNKVPTVFAYQKT